MAVEPTEPVEPPRLAGTRTHDHLRTAFALECQAHQLMISFERIARIEGNSAAAREFHELAELHALQAQGCLDLLRRAGEPLTGLPLGLTDANRRCALGVEETCAEPAYADMVRAAEAEGFPDAADWLRTVMRANADNHRRLAEGRGPVASEDPE